MAGNPVVWFEIYVQDMERAKMPIGPFGAISLLLDTEGNLIGLHSMG